MHRNTFLDAPRVLSAGLCLKAVSYTHLLRLLRSPDGTPTPLCGSIRQNYAAVMVDEYQDTNALQDALYLSLIHI